jgi:hypothetical protein
MRLGTELTHAVWGEQIEVTPIPLGSQHELGDGKLSRERVGGYLAKYATKHTEALGALDRRIDRRELLTLPVNPHVHRLVLACWLLDSNRRLAGASQGTHPDHRPPLLHLVAVDSKTSGCGNG